MIRRPPEMGIVIHVRAEAVECHPAAAPARPVGRGQEEEAPMPALEGPTLVPTDPERPCERAGQVRRERLLQRLAALPDSAALVLVVAPSGYGKTTVLSQWAAQGAGSFAWASLREKDNDPVHLVGHLVEALQRAGP